MPRKMSRKTRVKKRSVRNNKQRKRSNRNSAKKSRKIKRGGWAGDIPSTSSEANYWLPSQGPAIWGKDQRRFFSYLRGAVGDNTIKQETSSEGWKSESYIVFLLESLKSFVVDKNIFRILNYKIYPETKNLFENSNTKSQTTIDNSIYDQVNKIFYEGKLDVLTAEFTPKEGEAPIVFNSETQERIKKIVNDFFNTEEISNSKIQIPRAGLLSPKREVGFEYLKKTSLINSLLEYNPALENPLENSLENCAVHKYLKLFKQCFMAYVICVIYFKKIPNAPRNALSLKGFLNEKDKIEN